MHHEQNNSRHQSYRVDPDLVAGVVIVVSASLLILRTTEMPTMTALLPIVMLTTLIVLGAVLIGRCVLRHQRQDTRFVPLQVFSNFRRFIGIMFSIGFYVLGIMQLGFYFSTVIMVPVVAWRFGYRSLKGVLLADVIFTGGLAVIFALLMGQDLPTEFFLR